MQTDTIPEIKVATEALEARIALTGAEVMQLKSEIKEKTGLLRSCRKALAAFGMKRATQKKQAGNTRCARAAFASDLPSATANVRFVQAPRTVRIPHFGPTAVIQDGRVPEHPSVDGVIDRRPRLPVFPEGTQIAVATLSP